MNVRSTCRGIRAWIPAPRARASTTTCRRFRSPAARSTSDGPDDSIADEARAVLADARDAVARGVQPGADHVGPAVLLCRAAAGSARHDPEAAGDPAAGRDRRAGQSRGAGAGGGDRGSGAAGAARCAAPAAPAGDRTAAADRVFPGARPGLPVHRDLPDREGQSLAERPHLGLRAGADRDAGVLRPGQHDWPTGWPRRRVAPSRWRAWSSCALVRRDAGRAAADRSWRPSTCPGSSRAALVLAVLAPVSVALGLPFPLGLARTGIGRVAALGLGAERRLLCGGDATRQPDCARGRLQPGSARAPRCCM